jgi:GWxTD domain-containing protein
MNHKKQVFLFGALLVTAISVFSEARQAKFKTGLPPFYKNWLENDVAYIITAKERDVFLQLQTDKERDIFIEAFWLQRNPTPGAPENEFKKEHYRRIAYANQYYGRETTRPGWQTDRGRMYILLGPPRDTVDIQGQGTVFPAQIWYYEGKAQYGLPSNFNLVFFKRDGVGEYILYSPMQDGPARLLVNYQGDVTNPEAALQILMNYDSRLGQASLSLLPDESPAFGRPSLASEQLLSQILSVPERTVDENYAAAFLKFKDRVEVEYTANYISSDSLVRVIQDTSGSFFIHYSIEPKRLSLLTEDDKFSLNFAINGMVTDPQGNLIFQYEKNIPLNFRKDQVEDIRKTSLAIQDMIPLIPGNYKFSLLLKNTVSKEFSSFESTVSVPEDVSSLQMSPLVLGYQLKKVAGLSEFSKPFKIENQQMSCQAGNVFQAKENLVLFFQIYGLSQELHNQGAVKFAINKDGQELSTKIKSLKEFDRHNILEELPLSNLPSGFYKIRASILDGEQKEVLTASQDFEVSPLAGLPRPWIISKVMPASHDVEYTYILGNQLSNAGKLDESERLLAAAYSQNPASLRYGLSYAQVLLKKKNYKKAKDILLPFSEKQEANDQLLWTLGASCQALEEYEQAVSFYKKYLSHAGANISVLNTLGECYFHSGNIPEALKAWEKSLETNPNQESISKLVDQLKLKKS